MLFAVTAISPIAQTHAEENTFNPLSNLMSYAPEQSNENERFKQFNFDSEIANYDDEHELNDAWLGISAYSNEGEYVGYIEDAILDHQGNVVELIIGSPESNVSVQLEMKYAELEEDRVNLNLTENEFASILVNGVEVSALQ